MITLELCRDNGGGSRGDSPATVIKRWNVASEAEAKAAIDEKRPNRLFVRRQPELDPSFRD